MKIPMIFPGFRGKLIIENEYISDDLLIPIGCDCHTAYVLQRLHLRKLSFPFDWLNTNSLRGIEFVNDNLNTNFESFLSDLFINERKYIASSKFPYSEFMHEGDLIENEVSKEKFKRRIERFVKLFNNQKCQFIYTITSLALKSETDVEKFYLDVQLFVSLLKNESSLKIYIRFNEDFSENELLCNSLFEKLKTLEKITIAKYIRETKKYGTWGNERMYYKLISDLGIKTKRNFFPKIYLKQS